MINKFQLGGKNLVMQFVEGLAQTLQTDPNNIILIAKKYPEVLKSAIQTYQETLDMTKAAQAFLQAAQTLQLQLTQTIKHGAKLQYIKSLKHQCADDEELVYYKKGGSVDCGCLKKEKGGEVVTAKSGSAVEKFKEVRKGKFGVAAFADATGSQGGFRNAQKKKEEKKPKSGTWGDTTQYVPGKNILRGSGNNTSELEKKDKSAKDYYAGKLHIQGKKSGGEVKKECGGSKVIAKFKAKCGTKMKKHKLGGSLNGILFYQKGTVKNGITEKSDNTRVQKVSNKEEGVYEQIPMNGWDFVPLVGTYREAQRLDLGDPNASKLGFATSMGMDLLGAGMVGPAIKATAKASRLSKLLKSRGFNKITEQGLYRSQPNTYMKVAPETIKHLYYNVTQPTVRFKLVPTVDVSGIALSPLVQTLRVPTQAMAH